MTEGGFRWVPARRRRGQRTSSSAKRRDELCRSGDADGSGTVAAGGGWSLEGGARSVVVDLRRG